jgi:thiol-disulfide isomerase/thioredoxin
MNTKTARIKVRLWVLVSLLVILSAGWLRWHQQLTHALSVPLLLRSEAPGQDWFFELADQLSDPTPLLQQSWDTGKVVHRELVAAYLKQRAAAKPPWLANLARVIVEGSRDGDMSVRELTLGAMETSKDPRLTDCAQAQLSDPDPLVRLLGLEYFRKADPLRGVPVVVRLLDDPDPRVVARAEVALARWTKLDFGARVSLAIPAPLGPTGQDLTAENLGKLRQAVEYRKQWWQVHAPEYPTNSPVEGVAPPAQFSRPPLADFVLHDLDGRPVHLSAFKGQTVLLNFWATWCTACLAEMPELTALQRKLGGRIALIGVALDGVTDEHGHTPENETEVTRESRSLPDIRKRVRRVVQSRGLNYRVLLDPDYTVGVRFNGGELPTTVIIDASGRVRRRFIGERTRSVYEAMLAEADTR